MKVLIVYASKSGNTAKMAEAVADGARSVKNVVVELKRVDNATVDDLVDADAIVLGSPDYFGQMTSGMKGFIDRSVKVHGKLEGKVGGAFTSAGGTASGAETTLISILEAMLVHGMIIQGRSDDKHYGCAAVGAPKAKELNDCKTLGERVAALTLKLNR